MSQMQMLRETLRKKRLSKLGGNAGVHLQVSREVFRSPTNPERVISTTLTVKHDWLGHQSRGKFQVATAGYRITSSDSSIETAIRVVRATEGSPCTSPAVEMNVPNDFWVGTALDALLDEIEKQKLLLMFTGLNPLLDALIELRLKEAPNERTPDGDPGSSQS